MINGDLWGNYSEEDLYQNAISRPLEEKIQSSILLYQTYESRALQLSDAGFYLCDSFGKDSSVALRLAEMAGVKFEAHYNIVTLDPPELLQFGKKYHPNTIWGEKKRNLPGMMANKSAGPPTRLIRWCCEIYKEQGGIGLFKVIGVRAEESQRRKGMWQSMTMHKTALSPILSPILYWTEADVWQFIREQNIPYCSLYDEGFKRLGCIGCPMGGQRDKQETLQDGRSMRLCGSAGSSRFGINTRGYHIETASRDLSRNSPPLMIFGIGGYPVKPMKMRAQIVKCGYGKGGGYEIRRMVKIGYAWRTGASRKRKSFGDW